MQIDPEAIKALVPRLRDRNDIPPRAALLALVALTGEDPAHLVTLQLPGLRWQMVALSDRGICIVEVDPGEGEYWAFGHDRRPEAASLIAAEHPLTAVKQIEVVDVQTHHDLVDTGVNVNGAFAYRIHLAGRDPIEFPRDPTGRDGATVEFVRALQERL